MKIKDPLVKGVVKQIKPFIYGVSVKNKYDRAMLFCRYQEFYESPFKNIRGKYFTWAEFMKTYIKERKLDSFTYPHDWSGYNIPSDILEKGVDKFYKETEYDVIMNNIYFHCANDSMQCNDGTRTKFYLIGYGDDKDNDLILNHEIAHGFYFTNKKYKLEMDQLVSNIARKDYKKFKKQLIKMGYADDTKIIDDEIQAFMSTGLYNELATKEFKCYQKDFVKVFNMYIK